MIIRTRINVSGTVSYVSSHQSYCSAFGNYSFTPHRAILEGLRREKRYRFGLCFFLLAFPPIPTFLLSRILGSRVKYPFERRIERNFSLSNLSRVLAIPSTAASICPDNPPPTTFIVKMYLPEVSVSTKILL